VAANARPWCARASYLFFLPSGIVVLLRMAETPDTELRNNVAALV
jgi:hypothetical protein